MYDVIAVNLQTKIVHRLRSDVNNYDEAEAQMKLAVMRRGVEGEFFAVVEAGAYLDGEIFIGGAI